MRPDDPSGEEGADRDPSASGSRPPAARDGSSHREADDVRRAERSGRATIRRVELFTVAWTVLGGLAFLGAGRPRGALVLTLCGAVSIVAFRGLQGLVAALGPVSERSKPGAWRRGLLAMARWGLLGGAVAAALRFAPSELLGLIAGFSTLPAALMTEGALLLVRTLLEERR
ncbi:MAG: hypothetical protein ACOC92_00560 [bacterium]